MENPFWNKEPLLGGLVVLHTIQCKKVSGHIVSKLQDQDYTLAEIKRNQEVIVSHKNVLVPTEMHEVQLDKIKITEASIISLVDAQRRTRTISVNENEPGENTAQLAAFAANEDGTFTNIDYKKIEHERLVFRNEVARKKNSYFFRARDSENLFALGDNFYKDFKAGYKHFSFSHLGASEAQKKSIQGIASFIFYFENLRILIVSSKMEGTFFGQFKHRDHKEVASLSAYPEFTYETYVHEGIHYLEVDEIANRSKDHKVKGLEYLMKKVVEDYDVVLYDLPDTSEHKTLYEIYFPLLQIIQNVTFIVSLKSNTFTDLETLKNYYLNYKIKPKGCVIDRNFDAVSSSRKGTI